MTNPIRRLSILLILVAFLTSCAVVPSHSVRIGEKDTSIGISLASHGELDSVDGVSVSFRLFNHDYSHVIQEITLDTGEQLVECFRWDGYIIDTHSWGSRPHWRTMTVYAGNVEGCDEYNGWGHLPDNGAGFTTTVGTGFNAAYQATHETRGKIIDRSPNSFTWRIDDDGKTITVSMP